MPVPPGAWSSPETFVSEPAPRSTTPAPGRAPDDYRPLKGPRRALVALLALATATTVMWLVLEKPGGPERPARAAAPSSPTGAATAAATGPATCAPGSAERCVGGTQQVLPPPSPR